MNRIFILILLFIGVSVNETFAQKSWQTEYRLQKSEIEKFEWLYNTLKLRKQYVKYEVEMLEEAMRLAELIKIDSIQAKAHVAVGKYYQRVGEMQGAWDELQEAKRIFLKTKQYNQTATVIYNQAIVLLNQGLGDSLLNYINSYNFLFSLMSDEQLKLYLRTMKATAHQTMKRAENAKAEYEIILPIAYSIKDTSLILATTINLGMMQNTFDSAMMYYKTGMEIARINSPDKYAELLCKIGYQYNMRDDVLKDSALYYFLEADKNEASFVSPILKIQTKNFISDFFMNKMEYRLALPYLQQAYSLSLNIPGRNHELILHNLAICFMNLKQTDSARFYIEKYKHAIEKGNDAYSWMLYYHGLSKINRNNGDSCSVLVRQNRIKALEYAQQINESRLSLSMVADELECALSMQTHQSKELSKQLLVFCGFFKPIFKAKQTLFLYEGFLAGYAKLEAIYGNKDKALLLYDELTLVIAEIENEKYIRGHNEALVKYQSDIKDKEIAFAKKRNLALSIGGLLLSFIIVIIIVALFNSNRLNKKIKQQKVEMEQLNLVKDRLFSVISHDMRAPVSSLLSFIQLLDKGKIPADKMAAFTGELKTKLGYTAGLMDNLLNWAHSQMQGYKPNLNDIDLGSLASGVVSLMKSEADEKSIHIENNIQVGDMVYGDENMLALLLRNLLSNAIKFTHSGQKIILGSFNQNGVKGFKVQDFGVGIDPEVVHRFNEENITETFQTASGTANEKGTGLGLMLCKTFIKLMGGKISLTSEPGSGSCFTVLLAK